MRCYFIFIFSLIQIESREKTILADLQKTFTSIEAKLKESATSFNYLTMVSSRHNSKQTQQMTSMAHDIGAIANGLANLNLTAHAPSEDACGALQADDSPLPPVGCSANRQRGGNSETVQRIRASPAIGASSFYALCSSIDDRQPYTVILNRNSAATEFYRNWKEYRNGFGNVAGDHWIGLERLSEVIEPIQIRYFSINLTDDRCYVA